MSANIDFTQQRQQMVKTQIIARGIRNKRVIAAMLAVPRHEFVPEALQESAYQDYPLAIGQEQTISQPYIVALMSELLALQGTERVLEIGTGSGYQTAILAELAEQVISVERIPELYEQAKKRLVKYANLVTMRANGVEGCVGYAPYDAIIVTAAAREFTQVLFEQLKENGAIVIPVGNGIQDLCRVKKKNGKAVWKNICPVRFVPLIDSE